MGRGEMSAELDLDIAFLVGEMESLECEHSQHGEGHENHGGGPAAHYVIGSHPCVGTTPAYAACPRLVQVIVADVRTRCGHCDELTTTGELYTILGPVNK